MYEFTLDIEKINKLCVSPPLFSTATPYCKTNAVKIDEL